MLFRSYPPAPSLRLVTDTFSFCAREAPNWNTISISGYHIREAGSTAVQEVAFTLADGITYIKAAIAAGLGVQIIRVLSAEESVPREAADFAMAKKAPIAVPDAPTTEIQAGTVEVNATVTLRVEITQ